MNGNMIQEMDILHHDGHLPYREMKSGGSRIPTLEYGSQERILPMYATHEGSISKVHRLKESVVCSSEKLMPFL